VGSIAGEDSLVSTMTEFSDPTGAARSEPAEPGLDVARSGDCTHRRNGQRRPPGAASRERDVGRFWTISLSRALPYAAVGLRRAPRPPSKPETEKPQRATGMAAHSRA